MIFEKKWPDVAPRAFTSNGTAQGLVTVTSTQGFYVKQLVVLKATGFQDKQLQIKRIISSTQMFLGDPNKGINHREDLSSYLLALTPFVYAVVQDRPSIAPADYERAVYAEEPIVAKRVIMVDEFGNYYNEDNPFPINAEFSGSLSVNLDGFENTNPDNVLSVGSENGTKTGIKHVIRVDSELDLRVGISNGTNKANVNASGELSVTDSNTQTLIATTNNILNSINNGVPASVGQTTMANSMPVTIASDQSPVPVSATLADEPIKISGTENGQPNGPEFTFVNNRLQQILKAKDRTGTITYADFGTKNQRITQITYTAPSVGTGPGFTAVKTFTYTLVGNRYRRDTPGDWSLV